MTEHLARDYPERSTATLRGFGRALDRAALAGGAKAANIALGDARERFMRADPDWSRPLREIRPGLGRAPTMVVLRDTWRQLAIIYVIVAACAGAIGSLLLALA